MNELIWFFFVTIIILLGIYIGFCIGKKTEFRRNEKIINDLNSRLEELRISKKADETTIWKLRKRIEDLEQKILRLEL